MDLMVAASSLPPLIERKILAIILMNVTFVRSFLRPFPARENNPFLRPPKREEGEGEEEEDEQDGFSRASRLLEWANH